MRGAASALVLGAAFALAAPDQQILRKGSKDSPDSSTPLHPLSSYISSLSGETKEIWDEVTKLFPEAVEKVELYSYPKPHTRRPDSHWTTITKGADVQNLWVEQEEGKREREVDGKLAPYTLRSRSVDPSKLGVDPGVKQWSGYLDDDDNDKHLFYWFFESRNDPKNDPVVLWLNGGPGCSSLTGLFMELGPSSVDKKRHVKFNPSSWNSNASVIFLDQPVNVGFSYSGDTVSTTVAAAKDVYALLTLFFKQFPEYAKQDFHIAGESYAGHYVPIFTAEILSHKKRNINLKSVLIGNGLTDGLVQYEYYRPMACGDGGWPAVLDESECRSMDNALPRCLSLIKNCYETESTWSCVPASIYCNNALLGPYQRTGQNVYDIRGKCEDSSNLCYSQLGWISDYLNKAEVQEELGVEVSKYDSCNFDINRNFLFHGDWMLPIQRVVPSLLQEIPILIYAGDADFICNWLGNLAWTEALPWSGHEDYKAAPITNLTLRHDESAQIGEVKSHGNLTFIRLFNGGHMIPFDQPEASLDMFNRWIGGEWREKA